MKCLFTELFTEDDELKKDGFKALMPTRFLSMPASNSLLLSYSDTRIESLVYKLLKESMSIERVYDKRTANDFEWVGIVLRNIPRRNGHEIS